MNLSVLKQHYIGKYVFLLKDGKNYVWEIEKNFLEIGKAFENIGCVGFNFRETKRNNYNKGIGFYKIVNIQKRGDDIFAYVKFVTLITPNDHVELYRPEIMLLDLLYSSPKTCLIDDLLSFDEYDKKDSKEYESDVVLYEVMEAIFECNCLSLKKYLSENKLSDEDISIPDKVIALIESKNITDGSALIKILKQPSKMMIFAKKISDPVTFKNQESAFPELYNKLNYQFNIYDYDAVNKLYDYFCRAHIKYKKYYGEDAKKLSMEEELKEVFSYEKEKKDKEKAERKAKRKASNNK